MSQITESTAAIETTTMTYDVVLGLPQQIVTDDGQTTFLCYYPDTTDNKVPKVESLLEALKLEDATLLSDAVKLRCAQIPDTEQPPLMGQCQYLRFPDNSVSQATLTLYGYAQATKNQQGVLTPDTVLSLEGVAVDTSEEPWIVTMAPGRTGLSVSLQQVVRSDSGDALKTVTTTTVWYKDNSARQTRVLVETLTADSTAGTLHAKSETTLKIKNSTFTSILSQQIRSARSGQVLRETQQDELGQPINMVHHTYDARDRLLSSIKSPYDLNRFLQGTAPDGGQPLQTFAWIDDDNGPLIRTIGPDGRCGQVRYDGLQRPIRWELQRTAGTDHAQSNYVCLQEVIYGVDGEVVQQRVYDYLPGGLRLSNNGIRLSDKLGDWFWQAENSATKNEADSQTLTTETLTGTLLKGPQNALEMTQRNHHNGQVTLKQIYKRWDADSKAAVDTGFSTEAFVNARGQRTRVTEILPGNEKARQWDTAYDELGRRSQINAPDGTVVEWAYQGLSSIPTHISVKAQSGETKVLGQRRLHGDGNQGDKISALTVGAAGSTQQYTFDDTGYVRPDNTRVYAIHSDDGNTVAWYEKKTTSPSKSPGRLLGVFSYNTLTRAMHANRPATPDAPQSTITYSSVYPQLLGLYRTDRVIRGFSQTRRSRHSLRGEIADVLHPSGIATRAWTDTQNRRTRVRRGRLEYRYRYGAQGECEQVTVQDMGTGRKQTVDYVYDAFGREAQRTYRLDDKVRSRYVQTWSSIGQLLTKAWYRDGESTATRTETFEYYTTGDGGRDELKAWSVDTVDGYDVLDVNGEPLIDQAYTYDAIGNLLTCTSTFVGGEIETRTYSYENNTQPTWRTKVSVSNASGTVTTTLDYDSNGNLTTNQQKQTLTYTATGQLQSVYAPETAALLASYEYDEEGRLAAQWDEAKQERRILQYSNDQLCGEVWLDAQGQTIRRRALDEEAGLAVHMREGLGASETTAILFIMPDPQHGGGEEFSLNSQGEWQSRSVNFTPWGEAPLAGLNAMKSGMGYNSQCVDPITGSYHPGHGYRVYDPRHQAFYQGDNLSPFGAGGLNDRAYCAGRDPVNWHDPSGHIMMSRRDEAMSLTSLDDMIRDTAPPYHEPAEWWEWALLGVFFALAIIGSIASGGLLAAILLTVGTAAFATGAASLALQQSNPALSQALGWVSLGVSMLDLFAGGIAKIGAAIVSGARAGAQALRVLRTTVKLHCVSKLLKARALKARSWVTQNPRARANVELGGTMKEIAHIQDSTYMFEDTYNKGRRLNIAGHGIEVNPGEFNIFINRQIKPITILGRDIKIPKTPGTLELFGTETVWNAKKLYSELIHRGVDFDQYDTIRLLMCHSSEGPNSFAAQFSKLTRRPVKGFIQPLTAAHEPEEVAEILIEAQKYSLSTQIKNTYAQKRYFTVRKSGYMDSSTKEILMPIYRPQWFPSRPVKVS
ncbi:hypothetical protein OOJ96_15075 [Pseudomonas sp. 15FMM2]|uniref:Uncharacterized protein n=1 Tax=Pseudomonas imrae TaxID=2992837 RepID=A0ACC7PEF2_9PSED